ncbi:MAG: dihydrolipoamide acetyltransferase family protein [Deferrisomatales bacterium]
MPFEFRFPDVGEGIAEGEIVEWKVRPGDVVEAHQTLVVVETDKAVVELPSPVAGVVRATRGAPGDVIPVGEVLAVIDEDGEGTVEATPSPGDREDAGVPDVPIPGGRPRHGLPPRAEPPSVPVARGSVGVVGELEEAPDDPEAPPGGVTPGVTPGPLSRARAPILPRDRVLARRLGIDPDALRGTGPGGRVTEADLRRAADRGRPGREVTPPEGRADKDAWGPVERVPLRGVRRKVAEAMVRSLGAAAQVTTTDEARVGLLWHIWQKEKAAAAELGVHLTLLPFVIKAAVSALKRDSWLNAAYDDEAGEVVLKGYYHVGVAVETRDGLLVPVVRDADRKSVLEVARELQDLSARGRARTLGLEELRGGTFTVSNYGAIGGLYATPILHPPEAALLGLGRAADRPVAVAGALKVEKTLPLSLTFDHRVVDGATAQHFLGNVVRNLEDPDRFLVGA